MPVNTGWGKVQALLYQLGADLTWPAADALESWLTNEVVPMLRFINDAEATPGTTPSIDVTTTEEVVVIDDAEVTFASDETPEVAIEPDASGAEHDMRMTIVVPPLAAEEPVTVPVSDPLNAEGAFEALG